MNEEVLESKIESIRRCLARIESKKPFTLSELKSNYDLQDILILNLERVVQLSVDIACHLLAERNIRAPDSMAEAFSSLEIEKIISKSVADRMKKAVGFRNIAVHEYEEINWDIVYAITHNQIDDFKQFMKSVLNVHT